MDTLVESVLDGTLDALFVLAKTALLPSDNGRMDPDGANKAYSHLQKALSLAQIPPPSSSSSSGAAISEAVRSLPDDAKLRYASTLRSISTSFHNAAATLMNGGREAASVAFWRKSAEVGAEALQVREAISEVSEEDQKVWDSLRDKYVPYRLDILAYCLAKTGERKVSGLDIRYLVSDTNVVHVPASTRNVHPMLADPPEVVLRQRRLSGPNFFNTRCVPSRTKTRVDNREDHLTRSFRSTFIRRRHASPSAGGYRINS